MTVIKELFTLYKAVCASARNLVNAWAKLGYFTKQKMLILPHSIVITMTAIVDSLTNQPMGQATIKGNGKIVCEKSHMYKYKFNIIDH